MGTLATIGIIAFVVVALLADANRRQREALIEAGEDPDVPTATGDPETDARNYTEYYRKKHRHQ